MPKEFRIMSVKQYISLGAEYNYIKSVWFSGTQYYNSDYLEDEEETILVRIK